MPSAPSLDAVGSSPVLALALQQVLSERLREADGHRAAAEAVQARLAALQLELGAEFGRPEGDGSVCTALPLSQGRRAASTVAPCPAATPLPLDH